MIVLISLLLLILVLLVTSKKNNDYDFIFGYSTGHVGTTTLSEGRYYGQPSKIVFLHEMKYGPLGDNNVDIIHWSYNTSVWKKNDLAKDMIYVKEVFLPFLLLSMKKAKAATLVDMGHHNLYFIDALVKYLLNETNYKFLMVRLRRERLETAVSLSYHRPNRPMIDLCGELVTRYCPYDRVNEVVNKPPSIDVWNNFTVTQKALWIIDETEARWLKLIKDNPTMNFTEVYWSTAYPTSMDEAALKVAQFLNLEKISVWSDGWDHMQEHQHAGENTGTAQPIEDIRSQDQKYRQNMKYCYIPG